MKRKDAINALIFAGAHDDRAAFTRIYIENKIGLAAAKDAFATGKRLKASGMPCGCSECKR